MSGPTSTSMSLSDEQKCLAYVAGRDELEAAVKREGTACFARRSTTGFTGLLNQGATCYMNSLLQALYMTPEFRSAVYRFRHDPDVHGSPESSIPLQLQKLFAQMQLSNRTAVSTKALTKSFGWTAADAFQQHDVQELNRVLFDALQQSSPEIFSHLNDLYTGSKCP